MSVGVERKSIAMVCAIFVCSLGYRVIECFWSKTRCSNGKGTVIIAIYCLVRYFAKTVPVETDVELVCFQISKHIHLCLKSDRNSIAPSRIVQGNIGSTFCPESLDFTEHCGVASGCKCSIVIPCSFFEVAQRCGEVSFIVRPETTKICTYYLGRIGKVAVGAINEAIFPCVCYAFGFHIKRTIESNNGILNNIASIYRDMLRRDYSHDKCLGASVIFGCDGDINVVFAFGWTSYSCRAVGY